MYYKHNGRGKLKAGLTEALNYVTFMKNTPDVIKASYKRADCKIDSSNIDYILLGYI